MQVKLKADKHIHKLDFAKIVCGILAIISLFVLIGVIGSMSTGSIGLLQGVGTSIICLILFMICSVLAGRNAERRRNRKTACATRSKVAQAV